MILSSFSWGSGTFETLNKCCCERWTRKKKIEQALGCTGGKMEKVVQKRMSSYRTGLLGAEQKCFGPGVLNFWVSPIGTWLRTQLGRAGVYRP